MTRTSGFVALVSILIISAICLLVGSGVLLRAIDEGNIAVVREQAVRAEIAATYCAEEALVMLKQDKFYTGNETLTTNGGDTCRIRLIVKAGKTYSLQTTSTVMGATRKLNIFVSTLLPHTKITSWQEVTEF